MDVRKKDGCYQRIRVLATLLVVIGHSCTLELPLKDGLTAFYSTANNLYTNWLNYYVYQATPYDLEGTPDFTWK